MLELVVDRLIAQEQLDDAAYSCRLSMVGLYRLLVRAGYPTAEAHRAAKDRGWDRLSAGETV